MEQKVSVKGGIGFTGLLQIVFIVLKLLGAIHWSWVWVLAPLWIGTALGLIFIAMYFLIVMLIVSGK